MTENNNLTDLSKKFESIFGEATGLNTYFSPGRINLIGEHTDYNGGYVFPASITIGTFGLARLRQDREFHLYSVNFPDEGVVVFDLTDLSKKLPGSWTNYVKGMLLTLIKMDCQIDQGFDLLVNGEIPTASGLSSSSSLELLVGVVADDLYQLALPRLALVKAGQQTENDFIGVNSGIMDQFAIGFGQAEQAILLDCNSLNYEMVPVKLADYKIVIMNTNKARQLADSKYNERFAETREALRRLQKKISITSLGELSNEDFEANKTAISDETLVKRARHAVYENNRTKVAKEALTRGDLVTFGQLLNASHASLKKDYEVTGLELDTLAETAQKQEGVLGARMTGAGFGGCAIALVEEKQIEQFKQAVGTEYEKVVGYPASFYVAQTGDGAKKIEVK